MPEGYVPKGQGSKGPKAQRSKENGHREMIHRPAGQVEGVTGLGHTNQEDRKLDGKSYILAQNTVCLDNITGDRFSCG